MQREKGAWIGAVNVGVYLERQKLHYPIHFFTQMFYFWKLLDLVTVCTGNHKYHIFFRQSSLKQIIMRS